MQVDRNSSHLKRALLLGAICVAASRAAYATPGSWNARIGLCRCEARNGCETPYDTEKPRSAGECDQWCDAWFAQHCGTKDASKREDDAQRADRERRRRKADDDVQPRSMSPVGTWRENVNGKDYTVVYSANGTVTIENGGSGTWTLSGSTVTVRGANGSFVDTLTLSPDGNTLSGNNGTFQITETRLSGGRSVAEKRNDDEERKKNADQERAEQERQKQAQVRRDGLRALFHRESQHPRPPVTPEIAAAKKLCLSGDARSCTQARVATERLAKAAKPAAPPPVDTSKLKAAQKQRYNTCMAGVARETIPETGSGLAGANAIANALTFATSGNCNQTNAWRNCARIVQETLETRGGQGPKDWAKKVAEIGRRALNLSTTPPCSFNTEDVAQLPFWCWQTGSTHDNCVNQLKNAAATLQCAEQVFHFVEHAEAADAYASYKAGQDAKCAKQAGQ